MSDLIDLDECKELRNAAARLRVTVEELLAPTSATPSPHRIKLDAALDAVRGAVSAWDRADAMKRIQWLGEDAEAKREG
jgi:hypothetical protein